MKLIASGITTILILLSAAANAQAKSVFFELGGPGLTSVNYDMRFTKSESGFGGRIGIGGFVLSSSSTDKLSVLFFPVGVNYLIGKDERNYFELGAGITPVYSSNKYDQASENFKSSFGHLNFGYRFQPKNGGFLFRASINPVFGNGFFLPYYGGISFGYKF